MKENHGDLDGISEGIDFEDFNRPVFNSKTNGLLFLIHDYQCNLGYYTGTLHFRIYDNWGLAADDVDDGQASRRAVFLTWYVLQHYNILTEEYKPFITVMEFDVPVSGIAYLSDQIE